MIEVVGFEPNRTYVLSIPSYYHDFYEIIDIVNHESYIEISTDKGSFPLSENHIHVASQNDGNVT